MIQYLLPLGMIVRRFIEHDHINIFGYHYGNCGSRKTPWISFIFPQTNIIYIYLCAWIPAITSFYFLFSLCGYTIEI